MCIWQCTGLQLWITSVFSIVVLLQHIDIQLNLTLTNALVAESQGSQPLMPKPGSGHDPVSYPFTHNYNHTWALNPYARFTVILHILFTNYINVDTVKQRIHWCGDSMISSPGGDSLFMSSALGNWFKVRLLKSLRRSYSFPRYTNTYKNTEIVLWGLRYTYYM